MSEIMRFPYKFETPTVDGGTMNVVAFDQDHTIADVLRWLISTSDLEEVRSVLDTFDES